MNISSLMNEQSDKKFIAAAYIDIETAYIIFDNTRKFYDLAESYCKEGKIELPGSDVILENKAGVTLEQVRDFLESLSFESEDKLHQQAKQAAVDNGFVPIYYREKSSAPAVC